LPACAEEDAIPKINAATVVASAEFFTESVIFI
jgi:hypothetical protein